MLGEVEVPPDLVQDMLLSSSPRGQGTTESDDDDHNGWGSVVEGPSRCSGLHLVTLNLRSRPAKEPPENSTVPGIAGEVAGEGSSSDGGFLSLSLKRMVPAAETGVNEDMCEPSQSLAEVDRHMDPSAAGSGDDDVRLGDGVREETQVEVRGVVRGRPHRCSGHARMQGTMEPPKTGSIVRTGEQVAGLGVGHKHLARSVPR